MTWFDSSSPFATMFGSPVYPHAAQSMPRSRYGNVSHPHSRVVPVRDQDDDNDNSDYYDNGSSANDYFADLFGRPRYASQHHYQQQQREQELRRQQQQQLLQQQQRRNQRTAQDEEMFEDEEDERRERMLDMQQRYQQKLRQQQEQQKLQQQKQKEQQQQQQQQHFQQYPHPSSLSAAQRRKQQLVQQRQAEYEQAIEKQQRLLREQQQEQQQQQRMKRLRALQLRTANRAATTIQRALRAHQQRKQQARKAEAAATILRALQAWPQIRQARAAVQSLRQLARIRQQMALIAKPILEGQKGKQQQQQHTVLHPINKENSITSTINKFNNLATTTTTTSNTTTTATATATAQTASKYSNVLSRKELLGMQDSIERAILSLDNVPTNGDAFIRSVRKDAVSEGQAYLQIIDERLNALSLAASRIQKWYRHMHAQRQLKTSDQAARRVARAMRSFPAIRTAKEQLQSLRQLRALHRQLLKVKEEFQGQLESISDSARKVPAFAETSAPHAELQFEIARLLEALRQ